MSDYLNENDNQAAEAAVVTQSPDRKSPKKALLIGLVIILALAIIGVTAIVKNTDSTKKALTSKATNIVKVYITPDGFVPASVNVTEDTVVIWTNKDTVAHQLSVKEGTSQDTISNQTLAPNESYSILTSDAKTYHFDSPSSGESFKGLIMVSSKESKK